MSKKLKIFENLENLKNFQSKKLILLVSFLLMLIVPLASATLVGTTASLKVLSLKYEPYPAGPGEYFKMWIKLENSGVDIGKNVSFELLPSFPFSLDTNENPKRVIGKLDPGDEVVLQYKIRVDEDAVEGDNDLSARYCIDKGFCITHDFNISIRTRDAVISVADVVAEPSEIAPGKEAKVKIKLNNVADSLMKDIRVRLDLYKRFTIATGMASDEYPFTPLGSTNEIALDKLKSGEEKVITFNLIADPDAEPDIYKIPVILTYGDELGENYTREYITALIINDKPNIYAIVDESTIYKGGGTGTIDIKFINKGLSDVKFLDVELKESDNYELLSSKTEYIGNLDSDDYETAEFKIKVKSRGEVVNLLLNLKYRDAINNEFEEDIEVPLYLYSSNGGQSNFGIGHVIFILIVIGIGIFFYMRWKKKRHKK